MPLNLDRIWKVHDKDGMLRVARFPFHTVVICERDSIVSLSPRRCETPQKRVPPSLLLQKRMSGYDLGVWALIHLRVGNTLPRHLHGFVLGAQVPKRLPRFPRKGGNAAHRAA